MPAATPDVLFGLLRVSVAFPHAGDVNRCPPENAQDLEEIEKGGRRLAFFDETLPILLTLVLADDKAVLSREQAVRLFTSPALRVHFQLGYLSAPRSINEEPPTPQSQTVPSTPLLVPEQPQSAEFSAKQISSVVWSDNATTGQENAIFRSTNDDAWVAAYFISGKVALPDSIIPNKPLLALECTLTLKQDLDLALADVLDPLSAPSSPTLGRETSELPAIPPKDHLLRKSLPPPRLYGSRTNNFNYSTPTLRQETQVHIPVDPETLEKQKKAAAARQRRSRQPEYAFDGFVEVNLLDGLDVELAQDGDTANFPMSRLPTAMTDSMEMSTAVAASGQDLLSLSQDPVKFRHARSTSTVTKTSMPAPTDAMVALKRSYRRTVEVSSTIDVRMRTLDISLISGKVDGDDAKVSSGDVALAVEVYTTSDQGYGFEIESVMLQPKPLRVGEPTTRVIHPVSFKGPIRLQAKDQYNFLFSLNTIDILGDEEDDATMLRAQQTTTTKPIAADLSPKDTMSTFHQQVAANKRTSLDIQPRIILPGDYQSDARSIFSLQQQERTVCVVVSGRPIALDQSNDLPSQAFASRWRCSLDLSSFAEREKSQISKIVTDTAPLAHRNLYNRSENPSQMGSPVLEAANSRFTVSNLANFVGDTLASTAALPQLAVDHLSRQLLPLPDQQLAHRSPVLLDTPRSTAFDARPIPPSVLERIYHTQQSSQALDSATHVEPRKVQAVRIDDGYSLAQRQTSDQNVLVTVSLVDQTAYVEAKAPATFTANSPEIPTSQLMLSGLSALSMQSHTSRIQPPLDGNNEVSSHVKHLTVFQVELFIINRTLSFREFKVYTQRTQTEEIPEAETSTGLGIKETEGKLFSTRQQTPGLIPLDDNLHFGPVPPGGSEAARIRFLAASPGVHVLSELVLFDLTSDQASTLRSSLSVVVDS